MTSRVGIIANPLSGKDIRRLVAHATVVDNVEKANILRKILLGLDSMGVDEILIMPDQYGLGHRALSNLSKLKATVSFVEMPVTGYQEDTVEATRIMREIGIHCLIVLGGDGTNRAVAKECRDIPLIPISTGTNNVFPYMVEGTIAGLAGGCIARGWVPIETITFPTKKLNIYKNNRWIDHALIDVVVSKDLFVGARAIWDVKRIWEIILTRGEPTHIGMASIVGAFHPIPADSDTGIHIILENSQSGSKKPPSLQIRSMIAPGLSEVVGISEYKILNIGDRISLHQRPATLALDGEREIEVGPRDRIEIELSKDGPRVADIKKTLQEAVEKGIFQVK
ncbi:MAG TPA: NAD(+)/NADH kinase [Candidatus Limnocylindrales bacterium]|nr:NAD(+)/NADH kinase [Candidatus Limnocylindrales bacterium]